MDPIHGKRGKQRSVHNTYFTLPVLFAMLSNHYSFILEPPANWLVLILMMFAGAAIRQFFVMRHGYAGPQWQPAAVCAGGRGRDRGAMVWMRPAPVSVAGSASATAPGQNDAKVDFAAVRACWSSAATPATVRRCR